MTHRSKADLVLHNIGELSAPKLRSADSTSAHQEIELKLTSKPETLAAAFRAMEGRQTTPTQIVSTYHDTGDFQLWHKGFTLRLRKDGDHHEITLKNRAKDPLRRGEWTSRIQRPVADLSLLPGSAPHGEIGALLTEELLPQFESAVRRRKKVIGLNGTSVEVALDVGEIRAAGHKREVAELEFELMSGRTVDMLRLVRSLLQRRHLSVGSQSKAARGMSLAQGLPPPAVRGTKPALNRSDTIADALAKILHITVGQIIGNLASATDGRDPEGVHQLRVSLRRLRSVWTVFAPCLPPAAKALDAETRRALKILGPARDLDVFITESLPPVIQHSGGEPALARLQARAEQHRRAAYDDVRDLIGQASFSRFLLDLLIAAEDVRPLLSDGTGDIGRLARKILKKRHKKAIKAGRNFAELTYQERHHVRVCVKKLRYACDYFQSLYPARATRRYLKDLGRLQDALGYLNDARMIEQISTNLASGDCMATRGAAFATGWYRHRLVAEEPGMVAMWTAFEARKLFW